MNQIRRESGEGSPRWRIRNYPVAMLLAIGLTAVSSVVPGTATETYSEIMGCETGCEVAAAGFPIPFIVDYPGISPANSADLVGAILGMDDVRWGSAAVVYVTWVAVSLILIGLYRRR